MSYVLEPSNRTILVVEDEGPTRVNVADQLRDSGFTVLEAANGAGARALLEAGTPVDLVFSDIMMPGEPDGLGLAAWIRAHWPALPVILTSGNEEMARRAHADGHARAFLPKPYDLRTLLHRIREFLR